MACDPDADRLGVGVLHHDEWVIFVWKRDRILVCMAALEGHPHAEPLVFKTEVTSNLVTRIAEANAQVVDDLLVGFKYIGEAMYLLEQKKIDSDTMKDADRFAVGVEESHGVLVHSALRDKDAAGGRCSLRSWRAKEQAGPQFDRHTHELSLNTAFSTITASTIMQGVVGRRQMESA